MTFVKVEVTSDHSVFALFYFSCVKTCRSNENKNSCQTKTKQIETLDQFSFWKKKHDVIGQEKRL